MCVCVCLYVESVSRSEYYVRSRIKIGSVVCLYTPVSPSVPEMEDIYATGGILFFFEDVSLVEFIYLVFTRTPGGVTVGDSGLCCCVLCLSSAIIPLCSLILLLYFQVPQDVRCTKSLREAERVEFGLMTLVWSSTTPTIRSGLNTVMQNKSAREASIWT